jgi:hypothetical protein
LTHKETVVTTREDFNDDEWTKVSELPALVIMAACMSDGHIIPGMRELAAGSEALAAGVKAHPDNAVLQAIAATKPSAPETSKEDQAKVADAAGAVALLTAQIEAGIAVAKAHLTVDEYEQVRDVLLASARASVERLGDGFMGSGQKVTTSEAAFIDHLTTLLA